MERNRSGDGVTSKRRASGAAIMQPGVTKALSRIFFEEWARVGYAAISLERVAKLAGVGKAALYRRWPDKATMASALLLETGLSIIDVGEHRSLEDDLIAVLLAMRSVLRHPRIRAILVDLHAEIERTPALGHAIRPFQQARRARINALLDRAVERGEVVATLDRETAADLIAAPLYWRLAVLGKRSDRDHIERLARMIAAALRAGGC